MRNRRTLTMLAFMLVITAGLSSISVQADAHITQRIITQTVNTSGLVGYWSLDEGDGGMIHNYLSNNTDGVVHNASWVEGISGMALHFDGDNDYVEIADNNNLDLSSEMTLTAWVKPDTICDGNSPIIQKDNSYGLKIAENDHALGFIWSAFEVHTSTTQLTGGVWYHLAATFNNGVHRIFVNGVLENHATDPMNTIPSSIDPVYLGRGAFGCDFTGIIDEVYIYQTALTLQEVQHIYQSPVSLTSPDDLQVESVSQNSIKLTWDDNSSEEDGFKVYRSSNLSQATTYLTSTLENITTFTDTLLQCGHDYFYEVSAYNAIGESIRTDMVKGTTTACSSANIIYMPNLTGPEIHVSSVLMPFDSNVSDINGPSDWSGNYGKAPEIIAASDGTELTILAQDYDSKTAWKAVLLHIKPSSTGYKIYQVFTDIPVLDRVMGLAIDASGNRYYATGVDEDRMISPTYPPLDTYRSNIVRIIKLNQAGKVQFNIDLDVARHAYNKDAEMIINPMVASSSRLAIGNDQIALVHGINTDPDWNINGVRHQKALSTYLNATTGAITRSSSVWVSHSFDQRLLFDGEKIIEHHLGDAYPRYIVFARDDIAYPLFYIKGPLGENVTHTRLGNIALIKDDPEYHYIALFATESSANVDGMISGPRNLAIVRVNGDDNSLDPNLPDVLSVYSVDKQYVNRVRWLTRYTSASNIHAERPKLVPIGGDRYVVLWEEWRVVEGRSDIFNGVYGLVINGKGEILKDKKLITNKHHLQRGDDAIFLDNRAVWVTGNASERKLYIHFVDAALNYEIVTLN